MIITLNHSQNTHLNDFNLILVAIGSLLDRARV